MKIYLEKRGYSIEGLTREDVRDIRTMIEGAALLQRRSFYGLLQQIKDMEKVQLV